MTDATRTGWISSPSGPKPVSLGSRRLTMEPPPQYPTAVINITHRCNLSCRTCFFYRDGNPRHSAEEMEPGRMLGELERLRDRHGIVSAFWAGGEPMLRWRMLEKAVSLFEFSAITTNGTVPLRDLGPDVKYVVSLDGPREINDAVRGAGVFDRVLKTIAALPDDFGSPVIVQCVIQRENQDRAEELVAALMPTQVEGIIFNFYVPSLDEVSPLAWESVEEREPAVEIVLDLRRRYPGFVGNSTRSLNLMRPATAQLVTDHCPLLQTTMPLFTEGDQFTSPFCCYGDDVDCRRCGSWGVFFGASKLAGPWDEILPPKNADELMSERMMRDEVLGTLKGRASTA